MSEMTLKEPGEQMLAKAIVKDLLLSDHMGDVSDLLRKLLRMIGEPSEEKWKWIADSEILDENPEILGWTGLWDLGGDDV